MEIICYLAGAFSLCWDIYGFLGSFILFSSLVWLFFWDCVVLVVSFGI